MSGRIYAASLVALSLIIAAAISWPVFSILAALYLLVLVAWALVERAEANAKAAKAEQRAEVFADEICHVHAANEILCAELAASDEKIRRLSNDLLAAHKRISDAGNVIPLPVQRDGADLAALDAEATAYTWPSIARDAFPVREWGEEAEK